MLQNYSPRAVSSDGNCFYRAMSLALYGTEQYHRYLRVKTALEMIANPALYTRDNPTFVGHGLPILTPEYRQLLRDTLSNGSYSEMIHLFALSTAVSFPIQSYCCPNTSSMHPYTLFVNKSSYQQSFQPGFITVMWTSATSIHSEPNHFVLLVPHPSQSTQTDKDILDGSTTNQV